MRPTVSLASRSASVRATFKTRCFGQVIHVVACDRMLAFRLFEWDLAVLNREHQLAFRVGRPPTATELPQAVLRLRHIETFHGYDCTDDCSGREAGYDWAARNDITDERECDGDSRSFNEGCQAYVEEQADDANRNSQSGDETDNEDSDE